MSKMKNFILSGAMLLAGGLLATSCDDWLDLAPEDSYGSGSYWKTESHVAAYVDGLHKILRDLTWQRTFIFGEVRSGLYTVGSSSDGMTTSYPNLINQNFDFNNTGVSNFGDIYGKITNCNLLIARAPQVNMDDNKRNLYMAMAYGLRALYYFDLHRIYGGVPVRTGVEVIDGILDPVKLYVPRSTPKQTLDQVKKDIEESLRLFGNNSGFNASGRGDKVYWNKAATECLAAEVYLWSAKVNCFDQKANAADLAIAKQYLQNVEKNYGLEMLADYSKVFDAKNKATAEFIFAVRYAEGEATNNNGYYTYSLDTGFAKQYYREDGTPWNDPLGLKKGYTMSMEYKQALYFLFNNEDSRLRATFMGNFAKNAETGELTLRGVHTVKNVGYINATGDRIMCGDYIMYRLPWVYLSLAEIANYEDDNENVEKYINLVRERAFGANWDKATYGYTAGDFTQNELAILEEKTREFVQEGQRWWDLLRMTYTKGGDAMVFHKEATLEKEEALLDMATEAHKVLWPVNVGVLNNDTTIFQTPGYGKAGQQKECEW